MNITATGTASNLDTFRSADLDKTDFLRLLVTQVQNQDPLNPMSNDEFVAQLTQFSILEQNQNLNDGMQELRTLGGVQQAAALVGRTVEYLDTETGERLSGRVDRVEIVDNETTFHIGGRPVGRDQIVSIVAEALPEPPAEPDPL